MELYPFWQACCRRQWKFKKVWVSLEAQIYNRNRLHKVVNMGTVGRKHKSPAATFFLPGFPREIIVTEDPPLIKMAIPFKSVCKTHHKTAIQSIQVLWWITSLIVFAGGKGEGMGAELWLTWEEQGNYQAASSLSMNFATHKASAGEISFSLASWGLSSWFGHLPWRS